MIKRVFEFWKKNNIATVKVDQKVAFERAVEIIKGEYDKERQLEIQAKNMVEQLEKQNPDIEPHKMYLMIKRKLAEEKGVIL